MGTLKKNNRFEASGESVKQHKIELCKTLVFLLLLSGLNPVI